MAASLRRLALVAAVVRPLFYTSATLQFRGGQALASPGPLDGLRVVDWSTTAAASMCSRLLADFGAGVTFIAPADGHPLDSLGPRLPGGRSAIATYLFANKSFVTLDPDSDVGREQLLALARSADVVVSDLPPSLLASRGLEYATLASPRLCHGTRHTARDVRPARRSARQRPDDRRPVRLGFHQRPRLGTRR
ncbi:MAG: CoA transferase [Thermoflexaceae bacterium]|nr:CoA transferase [Thermoflexaceae bacterium]